MCSEAVKIKVWGLLPYTMLTLFFVHGTSTALLVTGCQKNVSLKEGLAPGRWSVMHFPGADCTRQSAPSCSHVQWCEERTICLLCHKTALAGVMGTDHSFAEIFMVALSKEHPTHRCSWWSLEQVLILKRCGLKCHPTRHEHVFTSYVLTRD